MADELSVSARLTFGKSSASVKTAYNLQIDVTGDSYTKAVQSVGITPEEILTEHGDLATSGYVIVKNLDATNYVEIGATTGVYTIKLLAGEIALWRHNSANIYAKANTASCLVEYTIIEA